jgi:hypothetical protein
MKTTTTSLNGQVESLPCNGQPVSLAETIDHEALAYRAWRTAEGDFLAEQLERLAQLVRWTGASTPREHLDRMEVWDASIREQHFEQGYAEGYEAARRECRCQRSLPASFGPARQWD